jgi:hypothetical protein
MAVCIAQVDTTGQLRQNLSFVLADVPWERIRDSSFWFLMSRSQARALRCCTAVHLHACSRSGGLLPADLQWFVHTPLPHLCASELDGRSSRLPSTSRSEARGPRDTLRAKCTGLAKQQRHAASRSQPPRGCSYEYLLPALNERPLLASLDQASSKARRRWYL